MPYNTGRIAHDADSHIMETPTWLGTTPTPVRDRIETLTYPSGNELRQTGDPDEQRTESAGLVRSARGKCTGLPITGHKSPTRS